jgi:hypothetical protein
MDPVSMTYVVAPKTLGRIIETTMTAPIANMTTQDRT